MSDLITKKRVLLIDEQPVCHLGLEVAAHGTQFSVLPLATSVSKASDLQGLDLIVLDISAAKAKGIAAIRELRSSHPKTPILILTAHDETLFAERCLKIGANGFLMKNCPASEIITALEQVSQGSLYVSDRVKALMLKRLANPNSSNNGFGFDRLSDRELLIVEQIGMSKNNKEIARELQISVKTIESHRSRIKTKLQLESPQELMRYAMRLHRI